MKRGSRLKWRIKRAAAVFLAVMAAAAGYPGAVGAEAAGSLNEAETSAMSENTMVAGKVLIAGNVMEAGKMSAVREVAAEDILDEEPGGDTEGRSDRAWKGSRQRESMYSSLGSSFSEREAEKPAGAEEGLSSGSGTTGIFFIEEIQEIDPAEMADGTESTGGTTNNLPGGQGAGGTSGGEGADVSGANAGSQESTDRNGSNSQERASGNETDLQEGFLENGTDYQKGVFGEEAVLQEKESELLESGQESDSDAGPLPSQPEPEPDSEPESAPDSGPGAGAAQDTAQKVCLGIDNRHVYAGMEQSFSQGYTPIVEDGELLLTVPYVASGKLKDDKLTVNLEFPDRQESPCELKNYQMDIGKKAYLPVNGVMQETALWQGASRSKAAQDASGSGTADDMSQGVSRSQAAQDASGSGAVNESPQDVSGPPRDYTETWLYQCRVPLRSDASPGQYSVTVKAWGYTEAMEKAELDYQIFFKIPEPEPSGKKKKQKTAGETDGGGGYSGGAGGDAGEGQGEELIRQPKLLVDFCSLDSLEAGSTKDMRVSLKNCSESQTVYNLKVVLQPETTALTLEHNSFYFDEVAPQGTVDIGGVVTAAPDGEAGVIPITFTFEYEDKKGTAATGTETVNLTLSQPVKMELETADIPAYVYASDTIDVPVTALNLGRTGVYNARIHLEGEGLFPTGDVFLGNMEPGSSGEGSMSVYVGTRTMEAVGVDDGAGEDQKYGAVSGTVTLAYEDVAGVTHEITREYQSEIKKAQILSLEVEAENDDANPWWISVFAVVIAGMALAIGLLLGRIRRKNVLLQEAQRSISVL